MYSQTTWLSTKTNIYIKKSILQLSWIFKWIIFLTLNCVSFLWRIKLKRKRLCSFKKKNFQSKKICLQCKTTTQYIRAPPLILLFQLIVRLCGNFAHLAEKCLNLKITFNYSSVNSIKSIMLKISSLKDVISNWRNGTNIWTMEKTHNNFIKTVLCCPNVMVVVHLFADFAH